MSEELKEIINKILKEHPDTVKVCSDWSAKYCCGNILVQIPSLTELEAAELGVEYSDFITNTYKPEVVLDECTTFVVVTPQPITTDVFPCVFIRE